MTWQLMWHNVRAAALNAMLQLLIIYRFNSLECNRITFNNQRGKKKKTTTTTTTIKKTKLNHINPKQSFK